jgi:Arc/MetJ-type ribon-helix-helix transcriptional regulator
MLMPKQQITITVEKRLIEWADREVAKFRFRNRSHAFEYAIAKLMETEK